MSEKKGVRPLITQINTDEKEKGRTCWTGRTVRTNEAHKEAVKILKVLGLADTTGFIIGPCCQTCDVNTEDQCKLCFQETLRETEGQKS